MSTKGRRVKRVVLTLGMMFVATVIYSTCLLPGIQSDRYIAEWVGNFEGYSGQDQGVPAAWKDEVYLRRLNGEEWVLAAIHHGACAPGRRGGFDAMVLLDNRGVISICDWAPCASGIAGCGGFWEQQIPAKDLAELYKHQLTRSKLDVVSRQHGTGS